MLAAADQTSRRPERATVMVIFALIFQKNFTMYCRNNLFYRELGKGR